MMGGIRAARVICTLGLINLLYIAFISTTMDKIMITNLPVTFMDADSMKNLENQDKIQLYEKDKQKQNTSNATATMRTKEKLPAAVSKSELSSTVQTPSLHNNQTPDNNITHSWVPTDQWLQNCAQQQAEEVQKLSPSQLSFPIVSGWQGYQLGDCIKACSSCPTNLSKECLANDYQRKGCYAIEQQEGIIIKSTTWHPCTKKACKTYVYGGNLTLVLELFEQRRQKAADSWPVPNEDELVIHFRLGDVIEYSKDNVETMLTKGANPSHARKFKSSIKSVYELLKNVQESGSQKVTMVGGSHKTMLNGNSPCCPKSRVYATCVKMAIQKAGYSVSLKVNSDDPDHDFYYMSNAKKLVVSSGGYSRLIGRLVGLQGGLVIGRTF